MRGADGRGSEPEAGGKGGGRTGGGGHRRAEAAAATGWGAGPPGEEGKGASRRDFVKKAVAGAGAVMCGGVGGAGAGSAASARFGERRAPWVRTRQLPDVAIVGAGAFGAWTALNLQRAGAQVALIDQYGPGNSRATSGGETRGVRTGYGNRPNSLWTRWARRAIEMWREWDEQWQEMLLPRVFFPTSDLIMRDEWTDFLENTRSYWDETGVRYEVIDADEIRRRWPVIDVTGIAVALWEQDAGVVRARRAIESVARVFERHGGQVTIARAAPGNANLRSLNSLKIQPGDEIAAGTHVFALGPWFPKAFPELMTERVRIPIGHVIYLRTPPGDNRYSYPHLPSYNFPGTTGWPALGPDNRGFRVRTGGRRPGPGDDDPDTSRRWLTEEEYERPRAFVRERFPGLADAPISETRACHYELSSTRNFFFDHHPDYDNVWFAGGGSAEGFKFGPVIGEYLAGRILGTETDPELIEAFRLGEIEDEGG